jgi:predicted transcriptional regulator
MIGGKTCGDVMTPDPVVIDARDSASTAAELMMRHAFSQLPVVRGGIAVGFVEERDIIRNISRDLNSMSVQAIMGTETPPKADERTSLDSVFPLFETFQAILVEKNGRLSGIITRSDLLRTRQSGLGR